MLEWTLFWTNDCHLGAFLSRFSGHLELIRSDLHIGVRGKSVFEKTTKKQEETPFPGIFSPIFLAHSIEFFDRCCCCCCWWTIIFCIKCTELPFKFNPHSAKGTWIAEWYHTRLYSLVCYGMPWAVSSSLGDDKLFFRPKHNIYAFFMILFG